jgi:aspartate ammonia-lyase
MKNTIAVPTPGKNRLEQDALGPMEIPAGVYWGIHTERAHRTFHIAGRPVAPVLIRALAEVKRASCQANAELGFLEKTRAAALEAACDEVAQGKLADQFPLDALQGGAGTSTNMNVNEVLANRALEILGRSFGDYAYLHPLDHVNLHQSTNDVYPTALRVAALRELKSLEGAVTTLQGALQAKEQEFAGVVKMGRTEMVEAVPMTLGMEFSAFAEAIARDRWRIFKCAERLRVINLGGTAVGTGLTAPQTYIFLAAERLRNLTGLNLCRAENLVDATANQDALVEVAGILKAHASNLSKLAGDLRLLAASDEIHLPALQAGSSIMPGKVNPVVPEAVLQASLWAQAQEAALTQAVQRSSLQICEFMPLVADCLLGMMETLRQADLLLISHISGVQANAEVCGDRLWKAPTLVTALVGEIGYEAAGKLAKEFKDGGYPDIRLFLEERLGKDLLAKALSPAALMTLGHKS